MECIYSYDLLADSGEPWSDFREYWDIYQKNRRTFPKSIHIWYGQFLDKLQVEYEGKAMPQHGGSEPGGYVSFDFAPDEHVVSVSLTYMPFGCSNHMIRDFEVRTDRGRTLAFHSWSEHREGATTVEFRIPEWYALAALGGTTGHYNPNTPCCIAGIVLYYARTDGVPLHAGWSEDKCDLSGMFEASCLYTRDVTPGGRDGVWENAMVDIHVPGGCGLFCASVSGDPGQVAMARDVRTALYDGSGQKIPESQAPQHRVRYYHGNFYQMYEENPDQNVYRFHICARQGAGICLDLQTVYDDVPAYIEELMEGMGFPDGESGLPLFLRPLYQMEIVDIDPGMADPEEDGANALSLYWWWQIEDFLKSLGPYGIAAAAVLGATMAIYIILKCLRRGGGVEEIRAELEKEVAKKLPWGSGAHAQYDQVGPGGYRACIQSASDRFYKVDPDVLNFYKKIFNENGGEMLASSLRQIKENGAGGGKPLIVDLGGEDRFYTYGIHSGHKGALNFNGKYWNSQQHDKVIPMLVHFQDWDRERFPLADGIVDTFMMQGTGTPTFMQACEMIRCLKKDRGARMDFWVMDYSGEACYRNMAEVLERHLKEGRNVSFKKWTEKDVNAKKDKKDKYYSDSGDTKVFSIIIE